MPIKKIKLKKKNVEEERERERRERERGARQGLRAEAGKDQLPSKDANAPFALKISK